MTTIDCKIANAYPNVNSNQRGNICSLTINQFNSPHAVSSVLVNKCAYARAEWVTGRSSTTKMGGELLKWLRS